MPSRATPMSRVQNAVSLVIEQVEHARATRRDEGDEGDDEDDEDDEDDAREVREDGRNEGTVATRTRGVKRARDAMGAATMEEVRRQEYVPMPSPTEEESHGIPSANKFILSFASRLNELVDGISQEL